MELPTWIGWATCRDNRRLRLGDCGAQFRALTHTPWTQAGRPRPRRTDHLRITFGPRVGSQVPHDWRDT